MFLCVLFLLFAGYHGVKANLPALSRVWHEGIAGLLACTVGAALLGHREYRAGLAGA